MTESFFRFVLNVWRQSTDFCYVSATSCVSNKISTDGGLWSPASSLLKGLVQIPAFGLVAFSAVNLLKLRLATSLVLNI